jgi:hypothetical protein
MATDNFCFYSQNRLIQTSQTGGQWYSDTSPLVFPALTISESAILRGRPELARVEHPWPHPQRLNVAGKKTSAER